MHEQLEQILQDYSSKNLVRFLSGSGQDLVRFLRGHAKIWSGSSKILA